MFRSEKRFSLKCIFGGENAFFGQDYVFDGELLIPYKECERTNPINVYGKTKLKGENIIKRIIFYFCVYYCSSTTLNE